MSRPLGIFSSRTGFFLRLIWSVSTPQAMSPYGNNMGMKCRECTLVGLGYTIN